VTTLFTHKSIVNKVAWTANGSYLISGSRDQTVKVVDLLTMTTRREYRGHTKEVTALALHPDHETQFVTGGHDGQILFWDLDAAKAVEEIPAAHDGTVWALAYHPLGHILVSGGHDNTLQFYGRARPGDEKPSELLPPRYVDIAQLEEDERSKPPEPLGDTFTQGLFASPLDPAELLPRRAAKREAEATDGSDSKRARPDDEPAEAEQEPSEPVQTSLVDASGFDEE
jgi:hypothetical protein